MPIFCLTLSLIMENFTSPECEPEPESEEIVARISLVPSLTRLITPITPVKEKSPSPTPPPLNQTDEDREFAFHKYVKEHLYHSHHEVPKIIKLYCRVLDTIENYVVWFVKWDDEKLRTKHIVKDSFLKKHFDYQLLLIDYYTKHTKRFPNRLCDFVRECGVHLKDFTSDDLDYMLSISVNRGSTES